MNRALTVTVLLPCLLVPCAAVALDAEVPDSAVNPVSGRIEIADPVWSGGSYDVHYVINAGVQQTPNIFAVADSPLDDRRPRMALAPDGDAWVVWWRDAEPDRVLVRKRTQADGTWSDEVVLSDPEVGSRDPHVAHEGNGAWVVFAAGVPLGTDVVVCSLGDEPDPLGMPVAVATAKIGCSEGIDPRIDAEDGHLWVSWIDSPDEVGWSEYDHASGVWGAAVYETYTGEAVTAARDRIRAAVLEN